MDSLKLVDALAGVIGQHIEYNNEWLLITDVKMLPVAKRHNTHYDVALITAEFDIMLPSERIVDVELITDGRDCLLRLHKTDWLGVDYKLKQMLNVVWSESEVTFSEVRTYNKVKVVAVLGNERETGLELHRYPAMDNGNLVYREWQIVFRKRVYRDGLEPQATLATCASLHEAKKLARDIMLKAGSLEGLERLRECLDNQ